MNKKIKWIIIGLGIILAVGVIALLVYLNVLNNYKEKMANTVISDIDLEKIPDGTYVGDYDVSLVYVKVEATVKNGRITDIKLLEHKNGKGEKAEVIVDRIIKAQSLDVDTVSGATNSSIVIKKAIEIALTGTGD